MLEVLGTKQGGADHACYWKKEKEKGGEMLGFHFSSGI